MSEEEKQVSQTLKNGLGLTSAEQEILVNYIDRLQKELEQEKEKSEKYKEEQHNVVIMTSEYFRDNYISKDKIKDKIKQEKELQKGYGKNEQWLKACSETIVEILEDLLKEN